MITELYSQNGIRPNPRARSKQGALAISPRTIRGTDGAILCERAHQNCWHMLTHKANCVISFSTAEG